MIEISPYENRSSGYRSHAEDRGSAPSPQSLTGKPSLTCSVGPFMVELFAAGRLTRSPERSAPVHSVARGQLPTPAALHDLARSKTESHGRDSERECSTPALPAVCAAGKQPPGRSLHRRGLAQKQGLSASPFFPSDPAEFHCHGLRPPSAHWIERWDYSDGAASSLQTKRAAYGITPTSLH